MQEQELQICHHFLAFCLRLSKELQIFLLYSQNILIHIFYYYFKNHHVEMNTVNLRMTYLYFKN